MSLRHGFAVAADEHFFARLHISRPRSAGAPCASGLATARVAHRLGILQVGDELPSERELASLLAVSRETVRGAIQTLAAKASSR